MRATSCGGGRAATRLARCRPGNRVRKRSQEPSASGPESRQRPANTSRHAPRPTVHDVREFGPIDRRDRIVHGVPSRPAIHRTYAALASESDDLSPGRVGGPRPASARHADREVSRGFGGTGQARAARRDPTCFTFYTACKPREQATLLLRKYSSPDALENN